MSGHNGRPHWRFAYLLSTLLLLLAIHPFFARSASEPLLLDFFFSLVVIASVFAVSRQRTTRGLVLLLAIPILAGRWLAHIFPHDAVTVFGLAAGAAFVAFVTVKILLFVLGQTKVVSDTIFAALCVYLLFGLCWGLLFALVEQLSPGSFNFPTAEVSAGLLREFIYFSLVTLTTVGYGDITPATPVAQGFSNLEAVIGQIYLVVLVARLVGQHVAQDTEEDNSG